MKKILYLITTLILLFASCAGNDFSFDEDKQLFQAGSTYFGQIEINGIDNDDFFYIIRKTDSEKVYSINLNEIPESFYVQNFYDDTVRDFKLKRNSKYKISNMGVFDATSIRMVIYVDENGVLKELHNAN
ncbi:MAG: hypothetical protein H6Q16_1093 [Bacteroidetes bacterium]|nr:hypothetical protein [Bacteroidota bacterium]